MSYLFRSRSYCDLSVIPRITSAFLSFSVPIRPNAWKRVSYELSLDLGTTMH